MTSMTTVVIPNVELTLDQLITVIRELEPGARAEIVKALLETELDGRMAELIKHLSNRKPVDTLGDAVIISELNTVRRKRHSNAESRR